MSADTLITVVESSQFIDSFWTNEFPVILGAVAVILGFIIAIWLIVGGKSEESVVLKKIGGRKTFVFVLMFYVSSMLLLGQFITMDIWKEVAKWIALFFGGTNVLEYGGKALIERAKNGKK